MSKITQLADMLILPVCGKIGHVNSVLVCVALNVSSTVYLATW